MVTYLDTGGAAQNASMALLETKSSKEEKERLDSTSEVVAFS